MSDFLPFLGALSASLFVFELLSGIQRAFSIFGRRNRLMGSTAGAAGDVPLPPNRSTWEALLVNLLPSRFDPNQAKNLPDVISLLRRAGYPYDTPGEFYAAAMRTFSIYLVIGGVLAGATVLFDMAFVAPVGVILFLFLGLRRPYVKLRMQAKKRGEAMRNNTLIGLSVLSSLLTSGVGVQEALRRVGSVGGPFCNLLGLLVSQMEIKDVSKALEVTRAHVPDPKDVEISLFLRDVEDFFANNRPLAAGVQALREAIHRSVVESAEERAALVRQRSGLFGVMAVVGLLLSIILPFMTQGVF
jgi:hypothetical protein